MWGSTWCRGTCPPPPLPPHPPSECPSPNPPLPGCQSPEGQPQATAFLSPSFSVLSLLLSTNSLFLLQVISPQAPPTKYPPFPSEMCPHQLILFMRRRPARLHPAAQNRTSLGARRGGGAYFGTVCRLSFQNNYPATNKDRLENKNTKDILSPIRLLVKLHISSFTAGASYNW